MMTIWLANLDPVTHEVVSCSPDDLNWHISARRVALTKVGGCEVSTVFLGMDHGFGESRPQWFETMVFGPGHEDYQERYETWDEAVAGHERAVKLVERSERAEAHKED